MRPSSAPPISFNQTITGIFNDPLESYHLSKDLIDVLNTAEVKLDTSKSEIKGECTSFASKNELMRREKTLNEKFEKGVVHQRDGSSIQLHPLKQYSRSAAGNTQLAIDILTPETIHECLIYISKVLLPMLPSLGSSDDADTKSELFTFLDNRLRSLGKDYESQSFFGKMHMHDMGIMFRIHVMRIFECSQTAEECSQFSMFQKLNNERMDAIQGVLLKYTYDPFNTAFFDEMFALLLLRCLGHDAILDARHWWAEILTTRRQMFFKLSATPLCETLSWSSLYAVIKGIHFIETGQWFAYFEIMKFFSKSILHYTLLASPISYIRVRVLQEIYAGRAIGGSKKRYVGILQTQYLADSLLFTSQRDLENFSKLSGVDLDSSREIFYCGIEENKTLHFEKNAKMQLVRPLSESQKNYTFDEKVYPSAVIEGFQGNFRDNSQRQFFQQCIENLHFVNSLTIVDGIDHVREENSWDNEVVNPFAAGGALKCSGNDQTIPPFAESTEDTLIDGTSSTSFITCPKKTTIIIDDLLWNPKRHIPSTHSVRQAYEKNLKTQADIVDDWVSSLTRSPRWICNIFHNFFATAQELNENQKSVSWMIETHSLSNVGLDGVPHELRRTQTHRAIKKGRSLELHVNKGFEKYSKVQNRTTAFAVLTVIEIFRGIDLLHANILQAQEWKKDTGSSLVQVVVIVTPEYEWKDACSCIIKIPAIDGISIYSFEQNPLREVSNSLNQWMKILLDEISGMTARAALNHSTA